MKNILTAVLFFMLSSFPAQAETCSLTQFDTAYEQATVIFSGVVLKVDYEEPRDATSPHPYCGAKTVSFEAEKVYKGAALGTIDVYSGDGCMGLGGYYKVNKKYLVYAYNSDQRPIYETTLCNRTMDLDNPRAKDDVKLLESRKRK